MVIDYLDSHYSSPQYTMKMIATLEKSNDKFDVLFIDDHSEDGSVETLRALGYAVIPKLKASGLTDSWNLGYSHFLKYNYETLFLANNDVLIPDGAIGAMQTLLEFYPFMAPSTTLVGAGHNPGQSYVKLERKFIDLGSFVTSAEVIRKSGATFLPNGLATEELFARDWFFVDKVQKYLQENQRQEQISLIHKVLYSHQ